MKFLATNDPDFETAFAALLDDARETLAAVDDDVRAIIADVRARGDAALLDLTERLDRHRPASLRIGPERIAEADRRITAEQRAALDHAATRIERFHRAQLPADLVLDDDPDGLVCGMRWTSLDAVGLYVPGGRAAYPSSVLMNAIPARAAGVPRIAMCVPTPDGDLADLVLAAARRSGITEMFCVGGAQAVAALAYGTETIAPVDRIVGPGNAYVASAKRQVFGRTGIDSIAGPSEVLILADATNDPAHVAMDLLAQAEHDADAQSILITDDAAFGQRVAAAVEAALPTLSRQSIAAKSWERHGVILTVRDWTEAAALTDRLAPEHLQIMTDQPGHLFARIRHAGAAFLGRHCPEAVGDYIAGPNHVLPTGRTARFASGLSVYDFLKRTTWVAADRDALTRVGPHAATLADAEGLSAHAASIRLRL